MRRAAGRKRGMAASVPPTRDAPLLPAGDCWKWLQHLLLSLSLPGDEESQEVFPSQPESRSRRASRSLLGGKQRGAGGTAEMDQTQPGHPVRSSAPTHPWQPQHWEGDTRWHQCFSPKREEVGTGLDSRDTCFASPWLHQQWHQCWDKDQSPFAFDRCQHQALSNHSTSPQWCCAHQCHGSADRVYSKIHTQKSSH